jgi:hypothetical protein
MYSGDFLLYQKMFSNFPLPSAHSPLPIAVLNFHYHIIELSHFHIMTLFLHSIFLIHFRTVKVLVQLFLAHIARNFDGNIYQLNLDLL